VNFKYARCVGDLRPADMKNRVPPDIDAVHLPTRLACVKLVEFVWRGPDL
jgi:hypothetical protein